METPSGPGATADSRGRGRFSGRVDGMTRKQPFSVKELFAVLVIVALLVALLLPSVQQAGGGSASRQKCRENLKQIGLALHLYFEAHRAFPPAYIADAS